VKDGVPFDFLHEIAAELPMQMICLLLRSARRRSPLAASQPVEPGFDYKGSRQSVRAGLRRAPGRCQLMHAYGMELIEKKRSQPGRRHALDRRLRSARRRRPARLTDEELYGFFSVALHRGSETTRNAVSGWAARR
jgi:cytochrome P450